MPFRSRKRRQEREQSNLTEAVPVSVERPVDPAPVPESFAENLGPLEALLADQTVSAILVNGPRDIYLERDGSLERAEVKFAGDDELIAVIRGIAHREGASVDASSPMLDTRLADGTVVNAIIPPLAVDGPVLSLRRPHASVSLEQLIATRSLNRVTASFLTACVRAKCTILVAGSAGAGKSTILQALVGMIPSGERVMTVEDTPELRRGNRRDMTRLEMPAGAESGNRADVIAQALKIRSDRLVIGDLRASEAAVLIEALSTDTDGALASIHAASPMAALERLETVLLEQQGVSAEGVRRRIVQSIDLLVQVGQLPDRTRRVTSVAEPALSADGQFVVSEIFVFEQTENGSGRWVPTGARPRFLDRLARAGIDVPPRIFERVSRPPEPDTTEMHEIVNRQVEQIAALRGEIENVRAEMEALRKPREARLGALLSVVDIADAISRHPIADPALRGAVAALQERLGLMLEGIGFESVAERGMPVDEHAHDVVGEMERADVAPRTIAAVRRRGFRAQGEIIRKASVVIAR